MCAKIGRPLPDTIQTAPLPFWQAEPCPSWCRNVHRDSDFYDDRNHSLSRSGNPIELSLHEPWYLPAQPAEERVGGKAKPAESGPALIDVSAYRHYRHAEPVIALTVPKFDVRGRPDGEDDVHLTLSEALALCGAVSEVIVALDVSSPVVVPHGSAANTHQPTSEQP